MSQLWFVTPAWQRFALSEVCFEQRAQLIAELRTRGIEAQQVVIADDENLDIARRCGFDTIERHNRWLGRRFNDGIEYAALQGAEFIVPIGSDSWVQADYFDPVPDTDTIRTATHACIVTADRLAHLSIEPNHGGGPYVIPRYLLPRSLRPAQDKRRKGIDRSTINGLEGPFEWRVRDLNPFQHIGFRGTPHLTPYSRLIERWGVGEEVDNPWPLLAEHYPPDLVDRARAALQAS